MEDSSDGGGGAGGSKPRGKRDGTASSGGEGPPEPRCGAWERVALSVQSLWLHSDEDTHCAAQAVPGHHVV